MKKSVSILARGHSLRYIDKLSESDVVILVNRFGDELNQYPKIVDYIKKSKIYLCISGSAGELDSLNKIGFFKKYNPSKMIRPYLEEISKTSVNLQNSSNLPNTFLSNDHKKYMYQLENYRYPYTYPTSGIAALAYAVLECDFDEVNIIGLDFYEVKNNSSFYANGDTDGQVDWGAKGHMQEVLTMLVEDHPKKYFNMVSVAEKYLDGVKKLPNMNFQKVDV